MDVAQPRKSVLQRFGISESQIRKIEIRVALVLPTTFAASQGRTIGALGFGVALLDRTQFLPQVPKFGDSDRRQANDREESWEKSAACHLAEKLP